MICHHNYIIFSPELDEYTNIVLSIEFLWDSLMILCFCFRIRLQLRKFELKTNKMCCFCTEHHHCMFFQQLSYCDTTIVVSNVVFRVLVLISISILCCFTLQLHHMYLTYTVTAYFTDLKLSSISQKHKDLINVLKNPNNLKWCNRTISLFLFLQSIITRTQRFILWPSQSSSNKLHLLQQEQ